MTSNFSRMPSVSISRSKFNRKSQHKTSIKLGELTPIYLDEVLPGDTRSIDIASLIRMSNPIAPVMDNIYFDVYAFFVPNRIVWDHWKEFMGENNSSAGIYSGTEYVVPSIDIFAAGVSVGSVGDHYGLPIVSADANKHLNVSVFPIRGYIRIYNRFFRDQNVIAPAYTSVGDTATSPDRYGVNLFKVAKVSDYFTRSLPYAQKGAPVTIPLGTEAPLKTRSLQAADLYSLGTVGIQYGTTLGYANNGGLLGTGPSGLLLSDDSSSEVVSGSVINKTNLYVDLSTATSATINQLRFAFQYQKLLEKDALYGTRLTTR